MTLIQSYRTGMNDALSRFKVAASPHSTGAMAPPALTAGMGGTTSGGGMGGTAPRAPTPPTAPMAPQAAKAAVL